MCGLLLVPALLPVAWLELKGPLPTYFEMADLTKSISHAHKKETITHAESFH